MKVKQQQIPKVIAMIEQHCCLLQGERIDSKSRKLRFLKTRQFFSAFFKYELRYSLESCGKLVKKDHATILSALKKFNNYCETDSAYLNDYNSLKIKLTKYLTKKYDNIVSVDFDGTLDVPEVQEYVKQLQESNIEVIILTSRYDDFHKHLWIDNPKNDEVYALANTLGIENIVFTNREYKALWLKDTGIKAHIDDNELELKLIKGLTTVNPVSVQEIIQKINLEKQLV